MKQGTYFTMPVSFEGIDFDDVRRIEFVFKPHKSALCESVKSVAYPYDCMRVDNTIYIKWTPDETYLFESEKRFFMDTRITLKSTTDQPQTEIIELQFAETLFNKGEEV